MQFIKYQGTGNDFVMVDDRKELFDTNDLKEVQQICDRKFGIGADGLILIRNHPDLDFHMIYFNADGTQSFCGNGSRCTVKFAESLGLVDGNKTSFLSTDGNHTAEINTDGTVSLQMHDVESIKELGVNNYEINTGSPHYIRFVSDLRKEDILKTGKSVRYSPPYSEDGINVNLVQEMQSGEIQMQTYERGVEDETLSCGTGVTAAALVYAFKGASQNQIQVKTRGGNLSVTFNYEKGGAFQNIFLTGPAEKVFQGEW